MEGKITKDGYRIIDHGQGCIEIEDRGFSVLVNPHSGLGPEVSPNIVFTGFSFDEEFVNNLGSSERFCVVMPEGTGLEDKISSDFELVADDSTIDIFGVKFSFENLDDDRFKLVIEMADQTFCYLDSKNEVKVGPEKLSQPVDMLILSLGDDGLDIKDAVQTSVAVKPNVVVPFFFEDVEDSKVRSLKAEIEDRNIKMFNF